MVTLLFSLDFPYAKYYTHFNSADSGAINSKVL